MSLPEASAVSAPKAKVVLRHGWDSLPALLISGSVVCVAGVVASVLTPGITPLALVLWALLVGPLFGGLVAQLNDVVRHADVGLWSYWKYLTRAWLLGLVGSAVPGAAGACFLVSLVMLRSRVELALLGPMGASGMIFVLSLLVALFIVPVAMTAPALRGWPLALFILAGVARRPIPALGTACFGFVAVWAAVQFAASISFVIPVPLAIVVVLAARATFGRDLDWHDVDEQGNARA